jgi:hypothetical protein
VVVVSIPFSCRISFSLLVTTGIEVTGVVVAIGAIVFSAVVETVAGIDVWVIVVGGGVWAGTVEVGDVHPATKIAASKQTIVIISGLFPFI